MTELNARFRELAPGVVVELIATRIEFNYVPNGLAQPESLNARWWGQEFLPVADGYQRIGEGGRTLETRLEDHATTVLDAGSDPVTGTPIVLSSQGAVKWLKAWFDYQCNLGATPTPTQDPPLEGDPE